MNIAPPASSAADRLIEMIPDVIDRVEGMVKSKSGEKPVAETDPVTE